MPLARAAALRAIEMDDSLAEAHAALGEYLSLFEWDRAGAEKEYRRAIEINPNYATTHHWFGSDLLVIVKRFDEAFVELKSAAELDPLSLIISTNLGDALLYSRRYDEAIAQYKRTLALDADFQYARFELGYAYLVKQMYREAAAEFRKGLELGYDPAYQGYLGYSLAKSGQRAEAIKILDELKAESARRFVPSYAFAVIHLGLNDKEEAFNRMEKDVDERSSQASYYAVAPELDEVRSDPRFKAMLRRMNLPE